MASLTFDCVGARAELYAAAPTLSFQLRISETSGIPIHAIALRCQIRIEPQRRRYTAVEAERLQDLFGDQSRWADTLKPIQFTTVNATVPGFTGSTEVDLVVPCTYDLEIAATRYFYGIEEDAAPLLLLFSGTVFARADEPATVGAGTGRGFQVEPVPWSTECSYRLPVPVWREMVDRYFPNSGWLRLHRDTLDALARYKSEHALPTFEATISALLADGET